MRDSEPCVDPSLRDGVDPGEDAAEAGAAPATARTPRDPEGRVDRGGFRQGTGASRKRVASARERRRGADRGPGGPGDGVPGEEPISHDGEPFLRRATPQPAGRRILEAALTPSLASAAATEVAFLPEGPPFPPIVRVGRLASRPAGRKERPAGGLAEAQVTEGSDGRTCLVHREAIGEVGAEGSCRRGEEAANEAPLSTLKCNTGGQQSLSSGRSAWPVSQGAGAAGAFAAGRAYRRRTPPPRRKIPSPGGRRPASRGRRGSPPPRRSCPAASGRAPGRRLPCGPGYA